MQQPLDKALYAIRYRVECFFHAIKRFRRIASRFEKTKASYLGMLHVAAIMQWLV